MPRTVPTESARSTGGSGVDEFARGVAKGYALYRPWTLAAYDAFVYGFSSPFLWRCPPRALQALYERNLAPRHLDVGVGTAYLLDHARVRRGRSAITLLDPNVDCLERAARRIRRYAPRTVRHNAFDALPEIGRFGSIGINYVLHCLPGSISEKAVVFDRLATALEADGVLFGSTILASDGTCSLAARATMALFNRRGIFCNGRDRLPDLVAALGARFDDVRCWRVGHVALFEARGPVATRSAA